MASRTVRGVRQTLPPNTLVGRLGGSGAAQVVTLDDIARHLTSTGLVDAAGTGSAPPPSVVVAGAGIGVAVSGSSYTVSLSAPVSLARGGTAADLSATGGASRVLRQSSVGAAVTVSQLTASDINGLAAIATSGSASDLSTGTVPTLRMSGSYTGITGVGTITTGTWNAGTITTSGVEVINGDNNAGTVRMEGHGFTDDGSGHNADWPLLQFKQGRGTIASPTATLNTDRLGTFQFLSYGTTGYAPYAPAEIYAIATEDHTDTAQGVSIVFLTTKNGTLATTHHVSLTISGDAGLIVGSATGGSKGDGTVNATGLYVNGVQVVTTGSATLAGDTDVTFTSLADKDMLYYDNASSHWKNSTVTARLDASLGSTQGQILYRNATVWTVLAPGTAGQVLQTGGAAANPSWVTPTSGGSTTLAGDTDVAITSPANTDALYYNKSATKWQNQRQHYDLVQGFVSGTMSSSQLLHLHRFVKGVTFPANFGDYLGRASQAGGSANATASTVINIDKATNAIPLTFSNVGTITFAAGTVTPTFASTAGATVSFSQGDQLRLIGPASADGTFAGFNWTLCGYEVEPPSGNTVWASFGHGIDTATGTRIARRRAVLGFAVDLDNNKIWVKLSNDTAAQWNNSGSATPVTNTGGYDIASVNNGVSVMPAFSGFFGSSVADVAILNTGNTTFQMSVPSGFTAWDTTTTTTWNPSDKNASITLTNSNLTASQQTTSGGWRAVRAVSSSKHTGKWYFEVACDQADASNGWIAGVANASATLASFVGSDNNGVGFQSQQNMWKNGSGTGVAVAPFGFGSWRHTRGTSSSYHTGKWYFELTADAIDSGNGWMGGVANASASLDNYAGSDNNGASFQNVAGTETFWKNGSSGGVVITGITSGQNLGIAVDLDNNKMWCRVNGATWSGTSGNPATNTGGSDIATVNDGSSVMPAFSATQSSGLPDQATLRTKSTDQVYAAPAGFTAWDG